MPLGEIFIFLWPSIFCLEPAVVSMPPLLKKPHEIPNLKSYIKRYPLGRGLQILNAAGGISIFLARHNS